ncbi:hypothetical protein D3C78_1090310 [compost metagenome]
MGLDQRLYLIAIGPLGNHVIPGLDQQGTDTCPYQLMVINQHNPYGHYFDS